MKFILKNNTLTAAPANEPNSTRITQIPTIPQPTLNPTFTPNPDLQQILTGKQLLMDDLPFSPEEIHTHYEHGYLTYRKGIQYYKKKPTCARCGNHDPQFFATLPCARCGEPCLYCRKCIMMGRISECTPLIGWNGPPPPTKLPTRILEWQGELSEGQSAAAHQVLQSIQQNNELLVWAVCGAGKTELLFPGIKVALASQKRICIATPRTDVVLELTPRLQKAFPNITIASLYGGSEDRHLYASLTIATTHQLMRFYQAFDTIILDEVDAFPYTIDESLKYASQQARKPNSSMIYLTATPNTKWQKECRKGIRPYITIPARFHRHSLPAPQFKWCGNWKKQLEKGKLPTNLFNWIYQRLHTQKQVLIFFPHIPLMEEALKILRQIDPKIESVHAEDPNRKEKVQKTRNKEIPLLLTTTILERGVTLSDIDVAVVGSEDQIFTESALVQIAGRAGRHPDFPTGTITFFHYGKTEAMLKAKRQIQRMNREALQRGLIDQ